MGLDRKVILPAGQTPAYSQWTQILASRGLPVQLRMIDGELAFPDETPSDSWKELRISFPAGMVTLRREADALRLVTWGNATADLLKAWNTLTWVLAQEGNGKIITDQGEENPEEFARREGIDKRI